MRRDVFYLSKLAAVTIRSSERPAQIFTAFPISHPAYMTSKHEQSASQSHELARASFGFRGAVVIAVVALAAFFFWPVFDASYCYAEYLAKVNLGLETLRGHPAADAAGITDRILNRAKEWNALGSRVWLLYLLSCAALAATVLLLSLCIRHKSSSRVTAVAAIAICWLALFGTRSAVERWSARRNAFRLLPRVETVAAALAAHWPTSKGPVAVTPELRVIVDRDRHPNALIVLGRKAYPLREDFGFLIERTEKGVLRFSLAGEINYRIEFHPSGSPPLAYRDAFGHSSPTVTDIVPLKEFWYLVRYGNG